MISFHRFSITKWIHLNDGDEGLETFFRRVFDVLRPNGKFVLEPQPWGSYAKAKRGNAKLKEKAADIQIKPEEFGKVLEKIGFRHEERFVIEEGVRGEPDLAFVSYCRCPMLNVSCRISKTN